MPAEILNALEPRRICCKVISVDAEAENELGGIGIMDVWASTEEVDHFNEVVKSFAFKDSIATSKETGKWPPFLVAHMHALANGDVPVIGRVVSAEEVPGKGTKARVAFAPADVQPLATRWLKAFAGGWITDVSVGFLAEEIEREEGEPLTHTKSRWLELSAAAVGAAPGASAISVIQKSLDGAPFEVVELMQDLLELEQLNRKAAGLFTTMVTRVIEETENQWRFRLRDPDGFQEDSLRQIDIKESKPRVFGIVGRLKGETTTTLQSLRFPKEDDWTKAQVQSWVDEHRDELKSAEYVAALILKETPAANVPADAGGAGEVTEDDDDFFLQIVPKDMEFAAGSLREIPLKKDEPRVFATVGKPATEGAEGRDAIAFLRFPKADGWSENSVREWVADVNLETMLADALGDGERAHEDDDKKSVDTVALEATVKTLGEQVAALTAQVTALASVKDATLELASRLANYLDQVKSVAAPAATSESGSSVLPEDAPGELEQINKDLRETIEAGSRLVSQS